MAATLKSIFGDFWYFFPQKKKKKKKKKHLFSVKLESMLFESLREMQRSVLC